MSCSLYVMKMLLDYQETLSANEGTKRKLSFWGQGNDATYRKAGFRIRITLRQAAKVSKAACHRGAIDELFLTDFNVGIQYIYIVLLARERE